jgi:hypothetical protein
MKQGLYGLTVDHEPGGGANVNVIQNDDELREKLMAFGVTEEHAKDLIKRFHEEDKSVRINIDPQEP